MKAEATRSAEISYQRSPDILAEWHGRQLTIVQARSGRRFALSAKVLNLLDRLEAPADVDHLGHSIGIQAGQVADLLAQMAEAGVVELAANHTEEESDRTLTLTACEWAVHNQAHGRVAGPADRREPPPTARLMDDEAAAVIALPTKAARFSKPMAAVLAERQSIRTYATGAMRLEEVGQFLSEACRVRGLIGPADQQTTHRASPSGGARHSLEVYAFVRDVTGLEAGAYHYDPFEHCLRRLAPWDDNLDAIQHRLVCGPAMMSKPPQVSFYLASMLRRVLWKYPNGALPLIYRDAGCLLQTMYLVATDLALAPCAIAAIDSELTPPFLAPWREEMIHVGSFALGTREAAT